MHWHHHANPGTPADASAVSNAAAAGQALHDGDGVGGWARHALARVVNFAAPRSEDFLQVVLERENEQRAAWAKRHHDGSDAGAGRPS